MMTDEHHEQRPPTFKGGERYCFTRNYIWKRELRSFRPQFEHCGSSCSHCVRSSITRHGPKTVTLPVSAAQRPDSTAALYFTGTRHTSNQYEAAIKPSMN